MTNTPCSNRSTFRKSLAVSAAALLIAVALPTVASATPSSTRSTVVSAQTPVVPLPSSRVLADNVVVSPGSGAPAAPAPAPQPNQTVVVPQAQNQAAAPETSTRKNVHAEVSGPSNYMATIAVSALMGALTGGLVGGAIYYLGDNQNARNIAYWAAGGVLVGAGVGIAQVMVQESRVSAATANRLPSDPAPTFRLALVNLRY